MHGLRGGTGSGTSPRSSILREPSARPLAPPPHLLPGETLLYFLNASSAPAEQQRGSPAAATTSGRRALLQRHVSGPIRVQQPPCDDTGTLYFTDYRFVWVPTRAAHRPCYDDLADALCERAPYVAARNGVVSAPYLMVEDVAWSDSSSSNSSSSGSSIGSTWFRSAKPRRIKLELKNFVRAEFIFHASMTDVQAARERRAGTKRSASATNSPIRVERSHRRNSSGSSAEAIGAMASVITSSRSSLPPVLTTPEAASAVTAAVTAAPTITITSASSPPAAPPQQEKVVKSWDVVETIIRAFALNGCDPARVFAYHYAPPAELLCTGPGEAVFDGWAAFDVVADASRLGLTASPWRVAANANSAFHLCDSYPRQLVVPAQFDDGRVARMAANHVGGRLPVAVWRSVSTRAVLLRCAPLLSSAAQSADASALAEVARLAGGNAVMPLSVIDCRTRKAADSSSGAYSKANFAYLSLPDVHTLRESKHRLRRLLAARAKANAAAKPDVSASKLAETGWLQAVQQTLAAAERVVAAITAGSSVMLLCATGRDHSTVVSALAQLQLDPYYRTQQGFACLVEKEWVHFGHRFVVRQGHGRLEDSDCAPFFLLFADCVWQLASQHPCSLEFNEQFLVDLVDESYAGRTGTFLANTLQQRMMLDLPARTQSFWAVAMALKARYHNPHYAPVPRAIHTKTDQRYVLLWSTYYMRYSPLLAENLGFDQRETREPPALAAVLERCAPMPVPAAARAGTSSVSPAAALPLLEASRERAISSSAGVGRAVAAVTFVAENDSGAREVVAGQEILVLEKTTPTEWLVSLDKRRLFMARVPAKNLKMEPRGSPAALRTRPVLGRTATALCISHCRADSMATGPPLPSTSMPRAANSPGHSRSASSSEGVVPASAQWLLLKKQYSRQHRLQSLAHRVTTRKARFAVPAWSTPHQDSPPEAEAPAPETVSAAQTASPPAAQKTASPETPAKAGQTSVLPIRGTQMALESFVVAAANDDKPDEEKKYKPTFTIKRGMDPTFALCLQVYYRFFDTGSRFYLKPDRGEQAGCEEEEQAQVQQEETRRAVPDKRKKKKKKTREGEGDDCNKEGESEKEAQQAKSKRRHHRKHRSSSSRSAAVGSPKGVPDEQNR